MALGLVQYADRPQAPPRRGARGPEPAAGAAALAAASRVAVAIALVVVLRADRRASPPTGSPTSSSCLSVAAAVAYFARDPRRPAGQRRRAQPGVRVHPAVHRQRGVLVAVPAAVHGASRSTPTSGSTATCSAGRCRCRGCSRSTRSSSSCSSGVFAALWTRLGDRQPSTPIKFAAGTAMMGVAFLLLPAHGRRRAEQHAAARRWPASCWSSPSPNCCISPVGLSLSRPSWRRGSSTPRWWRCSSSRSRSAPRCPARSPGYYDPDAEAPYFIWIGLASVVVGLVVMAANRPIQKLMAGVH